ncbi:hypothetical protein Poly30_07990 [Planctomycetes bacterium Poly30]|uniref:Uncharacterized protein n=1 Tax=Saltatorellus ferox TaxID=2528018 RepID=A0A518EMJ1_9BACT|nr:hypothetical protein Poly30_07990 [Planctomycetes bacterium Poly30]
MPSPILRHLRSSAFERLHLRHNPFGELTRTERAAIACVETGEVASFLAESARGERRALQLIADHGRGKSTLLIALHARVFPDAPFVQLRPGDPVPAFDPGERLHFVDSIENQGWIGRRKLFARCQNLACTTHRDLEHELVRAGFRVLTKRVGIGSFGELLNIARARVESAALPTGRPPAPPYELMLKLHAEFGDDVRSIEHALYHEYERLRAGKGDPFHGQVQPPYRAS